MVAVSLAPIGDGPLLLLQEAISHLQVRQDQPQTPHGLK